MAVTFQGGYVGGPAAQPLDMGPLAQGIANRRTRQDQLGLYAIENYDVPALAFQASQGDQQAMRTLRRYGVTDWQRYVPSVVYDENGRPSFEAPGGVTWDQSKKFEFEMAYFGLEPNRSVAREETPVSKSKQPEELPETEEVDVQPVIDTPEVIAPVVTPDVTPVPVAPAPVVATTPEPAPVQPVAPPRMDVGGYAAQQLTANDPATQAGMRSLEAARTDTHRFNQTPQAQAVEQNAQAFVDQVAQEIIRNPRARPALLGQGGPLDAWLADQRNVQGVSYLDPSQPGAWRGSIVNQVNERLRQAGYSPLGTPLPGGPAPAQQAPPVSVQVSPPVMPSPQPQHVSEPVASPPIEQVVRQQAQQLELETVPASGSTPPITVLRVGDSAIPVEPDEIASASHIRNALAAPETERGKAGVAAIRASGSTNAKVVRTAMNRAERDPSSGMRPVSVYADNVHQWIQANPAEAIPFFREQATLVLGARQTEAQTRLASSQARRTEAEAATMEAVTPEQNAEMLAEQIRQLRLANNIVEQRWDALGDVALSAEERQLLAGATNSELENKYLEEYFNLALRQQAFQEWLAQNSGDLDGAGQMFDLMLKAIDGDTLNQAPELRAKLLEAFTSGMLGIQVDLIRNPWFAARLPWNTDYSVRFGAPAQTPTDPNAAQQESDAFLNYDLP